MACKRLDFPEQDKLNWIVINKRNERDSLAYYWSNLLRLKAQCKYDPQLFESFDNINSRGGGVGLKKCENEKMGTQMTAAKMYRRSEGSGMPYTSKTRCPSLGLLNPLHGPEAISISNIWRCLLPMRFFSSFSLVLSQCTGKSWL